MGRLIDADELIDWIQNCWDWATVDGITSTTVLKQTMTDISQLPTVEAIPKDQYEQRLKENNELINDLEELRTMINKFAESYENRLKADMVAMLTDIQAEFKEGLRCKGCCNNCVNACEDIPAGWFLDFIDAKINSLKEKGND